MRFRKSLIALFALSPALSALFANDRSAPASAASSQSEVFKVADASHYTFPSAEFALFRRDDDPSAAQWLDSFYRFVPQASASEMFGETLNRSKRTLQARTVNVTVAPGGALTFDPSTVAINVGDTVTWTWAGSGHTVTSGDPNKCSPDNQFCSPGNANCASAPTSNSGAVYSHTFNQPGSFTYFCNPHCFFGMSGRVIVNAVVQSPTIQFSAANYTVSEGGGQATIAVTRTGDASQAASVDYATSNGSASDRKDYIAAYGSLSFAAGESSKTFGVLIIENGFVDGNRTVNLALSNPTGGATLGAQSAAVLTIQDNDAQPAASNPIDSPQFFVREHYLDFLNRDYDQAGLDFWVSQINSCNNDATCIDVKRQNVSAAYFLSIEFQQTGYLVYKIYKAAFGNIPNTPVPVRYADFLRDTQQIARGIVVTSDNSNHYQEQLEANKQAFVNSFVARAAFVSQYPSSLTNAQYVDALNANAGGALSPSDRDALDSGLNSGSETRASALRRVAENAAVDKAEFARAFVLMQYFGYLRRNPDDAPDGDFRGYNFWLQKLNSFNGDYIASEMVRSFIVSQEYRRRFGAQ